ncbi:MAG TPA: ferritin family protein [Anaeromyxobacteraceae bacterium]|nr:ferritin family protein [Anaeromyxobacteraceae bacterium]
MAIDFSKLDLRDALDLAILMEEEARERYVEFSKIVGGRYPGDASDVFKMMAAYEVKHEEQLQARRRSLFKEAPVRVSMDQLDDAEAPDRGQPRVFMSARDAMEVALRAEEKAWDFFDQALREVKDAGVRALFEELRGEEASHRKLLADKMRGMPKGPDLTEAEADAPGSDGG